LIPLGFRPGDTELGQGGGPVRANFTIRPGDEPAVVALLILDGMAAIRAFPLPPGLKVMHISITVYNGQPGRTGSRAENGFQDFRVYLGRFREGYKRSWLGSDWFGKGAPDDATTSAVSSTSTFFRRPPFPFGLTAAVPGPPVLVASNTHVSFPSTVLETGVLFVRRNPWAPQVTVYQLAEVIETVLANMDGSDFQPVTSLILYLT